MKRILHVLLFAVLILCLLFTVACESECTEHTDTDKNHKCDSCGAEYTAECTEHTDADKNHKCDSCGADYTAECTEHTDADKNHKCDYCEADYTAECTEHTDDDGDVRCDYCGAEAFIPNATLFLMDEKIGDGNYAWLDTSTGTIKIPLADLMRRLGCVINFSEESHWISHKYKVIDVDKLIENGVAIPYGDDFIAEIGGIGDIGSFLRNVEGLIYNHDDVNHIVRLYQPFYIDYEVDYLLAVNGLSLNLKYFFDVNYEDTGLMALPITQMARVLDATVRIDGTKYTMEYEGKTLVLDSSLEDFGLPYAMEDGGIRTVINGELIVDLESARYPLFELAGGIITIHHEDHKVYCYNTNYDCELVDIYNTDWIEDIYLLNIDGRETFYVPIVAVMSNLGIDATTVWLEPTVEITKGDETYYLYFCETEEEFVEEENYFCVLWKDAKTFAREYVVDCNLLTELFDALGITVTRDEENKTIKFSLN